jgi:hypothetical protein
MTTAKLTDARQKELAVARREMRRNGAADLFDAERQTKPDSPPLHRSVLSGGSEQC